MKFELPHCLRDHSYRTKKWNTDTILQQTHQWDVPFRFQWLCALSFLLFSTGWSHATNKIMSGMLITFSIKTFIGQHNVLRHLIISTTCACHRQCDELVCGQSTAGKCTPSNTCVIYQWAIVLKYIHIILLESNSCNLPNSSAVNVHNALLIQTVYFTRYLHVIVTFWTARPSLLSWNT